MKVYGSLQVIPEFLLKRALYYQSACPSVRRSIVEFLLYQNVNCGEKIVMAIEIFHFLCLTILCVYVNQPSLFLLFYSILLFMKLQLFSLLSKVMLFYGFYRASTSEKEKLPFHRNKKQTKQEEKVYRGREGQHTQKTPETRGSYVI